MAGNRLYGRAAIYEIYEYDVGYVGANYNETVENESFRKYSESKLEESDHRTSASLSVRGES